jgi:DNA-binding PadR family transcriptional regulator
MLGQVDRIVTYEQQTAAAPRSLITWTVLGLVIERPSYGYELLQRYSRTYGQTQALTGVKQIYNALDALRSRSLIEQVREEDVRGADHDSTARRLPRPHYRATEDGVHAYEEWLLAQMEQERQRSRLFARQLAMLEPGAALEVLEEYEREWLSQADEASPAETAKEALAERLLEGEEQTSLEVRLAWIEYARNELKAVISEQADAAGES